MVDKISSQQAYINYVMDRLPDVKRGDVHTLKNGDNLWNLAKKALNNDKATNQQISDYMLLIAKLNNLDTVEKMNGLKVSDKIYMPEASGAAKLKQFNPKSTVRERTSAEKSIMSLKEQILTDKTVFTEMAYPRSMNLYHVYNDYKNPEIGYYSRKHPLVTFRLDKQGNVSKISYDDEKQINPIEYDYDIDAKGNIVIDNYVRQIKVGKLDKQELAELHNILKQLTQKAELSY